MSRRADRLTLWFDGSARPNPGPMTIAIVARGQAILHRLDRVGDSTSAEWAALLAAVDHARVLAADDILLLGDARAVIEQASGRWRCPGDGRARFAAATASFTRVTLRHVGRSHNLAGIALDRHLARPAPETRTPCA